MADPSLDTAEGGGDHVAGDLVLVVQAVAAAVGDATLARVRGEIGDDVRVHDGYVFQHLLVRPHTVSELAAALGVSQQAASKHVADLEARRLVTRSPSPTDRRAVQVTLSRRGQRAVEAARRARAAIAAECEAVLGAESVDRLLADLRALADPLGALDVLGSRRLRPEDVR